MLDDPDCAGAQSKIFMSFQPELKEEMVVGEGFEPSKSMTADLQSAPFGRSGTPPGVLRYLMVPATGIELVTY